jgi:hypothetical protein
MEFILRRDRGNDHGALNLNGLCDENLDLRGCENELRVYRS